MFRESQNKNVDHATQQFARLFIAYLDSNMLEVEKVENHQLIKTRRIMNKKEESQISYEESYAKISRKILWNAPQKQLSTLEQHILLLLHIKANHITGQVHTSYDAIVAELRLMGKDPKNAVTKAMGRLKKKRCLYFPNHQGRRSNIQVDLNEFRLSENTEYDIDDFFEGDLSRSKAKHVKYLGSSNDEHKNHYCQTKVEYLNTEQKLVVAPHNEVQTLAIELINWAAEKRGDKFLDEDYQLKMLLELKNKGFSPNQIKDSFIELLHSDYWQKQDRLPDFKTVWSDLKNNKYALRKAKKQKLQEEEQEQKK